MRKIREDEMFDALEQTVRDAARFADGQVS